jgi:mono/diheme cytochrome c family protein
MVTAPNRIVGFGGLVTICAVHATSTTEQSMKVKATRIAVVVCNTLASLLVTGTTWMATSAPAGATQQFATQTGQSCAACHQNPKGGGPLTPVGEKFKANGNKMPAKDAPTTPK